MFDLGASELLLIVVVAILVIGPKDMPVALRTAGRWIGKVRRLSGHFRSGLDAMIREAEMEEMEKTWKKQNDQIMAHHPASRPVEDEATGALPPRTSSTDKDREDRQGDASGDLGQAFDDPAYRDGPYPAATHGDAASETLASASVQSSAEAADGREHAANLPAGALTQGDKSVPESQALDRRSRT